MLLFVLLVFLLASCGVKGRFGAKRGALEALPSVWVQIENPDSLVKGTVAEGQVHTGGCTVIYNVEVASQWHSEVIYQMEIPSRLPWDPSIGMGSEHPDDITVLFKVPDKAEGPTELVFRISYVWAYVVGARGSMATYTNSPRTDEVEVTLHVLDR